MKNGRENNRYRFAFEVSGALACFSAPDALPYYVTYPFPTLSTCEGWVKHIQSQRSAIAVIEKLEICSPLQYERLDFLNSSHGRYVNNVKSKTSDMIARTCLRDVCYKVYGYTDADHRYHQGTVNNLHAYQCQLLRAIVKGNPRFPLYFGSNEFPISYFGELRPETQPLESLTITIPQMVVRTFSNFKRGHFIGKTAMVSVNKGVVLYENIYTNVS